jgi:hypothetical protein
MQLSEVLKRHSVVGLVGNRSTAKTSLILQLFLELRKDHPKVKIAVMGINPELQSVLNKYSISVLHSKMDILDLQMKDTILFIDEMALFFETQTKNKQLSKLQRFFDRIEHQNCKIIIGTAREGYFNKFMCSRITAFMVKQIEYEALVNGTWLKERVKAISSISDYRLVACKSEYYLVTAGDGTPTTKHTFIYNPEIDTKKNNLDLFGKEEKDLKKSETKSEVVREKKGEKKSEKKVKEKVNT